MLFLANYCHSLLGVCKNTGTLVYHGIRLAWYVPRYTCLYGGILMILFLATVYCRKPLISKILTHMKVKELEMV